MFLLTFLLSFLWRFSHTKTDLTLCLAHFLTILSIKLNYFRILCKKITEICTCINWCSPKSDRWFFFLIFTVKGPFHRNDFKGKKYGVMGLISKKRKFCKQNLTKERKQPPVVIPQKVIFYNVFIPCLWLRIIRTSAINV